MLCAGFLAAQNGTDCGEGSDCSVTKNPFSDEYEYTFVKTNVHKNRNSDADGKECDFYIRLYEKKTGILKYKYRLQGDADPSIPSRWYGSLDIQIWQNGGYEHTPKNWHLETYSVESSEKQPKGNTEGDCESVKKGISKGMYYFYYSKNSSEYYYTGYKTQEECLMGVISRITSIKGIFFKEYIRC